ncbi:MAG: hypothetical protein R3B66_04135 [Candidatus Scalinduaceae bacterium]
MALYKEGRKTRSEKIKGEKHGLLLNFTKKGYLGIKGVIYDYGN